MPAVDGANDNASGVAVMLGALERIVPTPEESGTTSFPAIRRGVEAAQEADVVPVGASVSDASEEPSGPAEPARTAEHDPTELPDDFRWADTPAAAAPRQEPGPSQRRLEFETIEFDAIGAQDMTEEGWEESSPPDSRTPGCRAGAGA
jgi:hypothetical protein